MIVRDIAWPVLLVSLGLLFMALSASTDSMVLAIGQAFDSPHMPFLETTLKTSYVIGSLMFILALSCHIALRESNRRNITSYLTRTCVVGKWLIVVGVAHVVFVQMSTIVVMGHNSMFNGDVTYIATTGFWGMYYYAKTDSSGNERMMDVLLLITWAAALASPMAALPHL